MSMLSCADHDIYAAGCRPCAGAARTYHRARAKDRAYHGPRMVPAGPVQEHVRSLVAGGATLAAIVTASGVAQPTLSRALHESRRTVRRAFAQALLAVSVDDVTAAEHRVPAFALARRLQHLTWMGWSQLAISRGAGINPTTVAAIATGQRARVDRTVATALMRFYRAHWQEDGGSTRARNAARHHGWVSIMAWDDPDSPEGRAA